MLALVVVAGPADAELAADALWSLGVVAIEERRGPAGEVELWTSLGDDRATIERSMSACLEPLVSCRWQFVEVDESVADSWRDHAVPTWVEPDLVVVPAWLPIELGTSDPSIDAAAITVISIEPGATFGAGDHPTTVLSLRALRKVLGKVLGSATADRRPAVLDVGCGSGVLSVAAALLGARTAHGIDISPAAVPTATENARRNDVASTVSASTEALCDVTGSYDVVIANILAPVLIELSHDLLRVLADDGRLIISGVLVGRFDHVLQSLAPLRVTRVDELDGWAAVTLQR
jgi:ribosomal protein L11 methyltransferase